MARDTSDSYLRRRAKKRRRNAAAFNLVQKIMGDGCSKKSAAVVEAAAKLGRSPRSVWTSLDEYPQELAEEERINRQWELENGLAEPTPEETKEIEQLWIEMQIDRRRGK